MPNYFYSIMMWQVWGKKKRYKPFRGSVIRICTGGWAKIKSGLESFYMDLQCHAPVDLLSPEQKTDLHLQWPLQCQEKLIKNITSWAYVVVRFRFAGVLTHRYSSLSVFWINFKETTELTFLPFNHGLPLLLALLQTRRCITIKQEEWVTESQKLDRIFLKPKGRLNMLYKFYYFSFTS